MTYAHIYGIDVTNWNEPRVLLYDHICNSRVSLPIAEVDDLLLLDFIHYRIAYFEAKIKTYMDQIISLRHVKQMVDDRRPNFFDGIP